MKSMARRALALLLCVLMLTSSVPVEVFAANGAEDPIEDPIGEDPAADPGENPGEDPAADPGENPGEDPAADPGENPGEDPAADPGEDPDEILPPKELPPLKGPAPDNNSGDPDGEIIPGSVEEVSDWIVNGYTDPETSDHFAGSDELFLNNFSQISALSGTAETSTTVLAGDRVEYKIHYQYKAAPNWSYGYDRLQNFFDVYENNSVSLTLPAGLSLVEVKTDGYKNYTTVTNPDGSHTYTFSRPNVGAASGTPFDFNIVVFTGGNGTDHGNKTYDLTNALSVTTSFKVLNKRANPALELKTYTQTRTASLPSITASTNDIWGVEKECTSAVRDTTNN